MQSTGNYGWRPAQVAQGAASNYGNRQLEIANNRNGYYMPTANRASQEFGVDPYFNNNNGESFFLMGNKDRNGNYQYGSPSGGVHKINPNQAPNTILGGGDPWVQAQRGEQFSQNVPPPTVRPQSGQQAAVNPSAGQFWDQNGRTINYDSNGAQQYANTMDQASVNPTTATGAPQYGLLGAENALQQGLSGATGAINQGVGQAQQTLSPYSQGGNGAFNLQSALTGAMGPQAQSEAYANYQESPGQAYLREQGEKSIMRNASATGGLGGGNVLQELQRHGIGLAAQDFQNSFNRLGSVADKGYGSAQMLGGIQANAGNNIGQMAYGTGANQASARTRAGEQIANSMQTTSSNLANLINQQGADVNSTVAAGGSNISNAIIQAANQSGMSQEQMALFLSNINSGQANAYSAQPAIGGFVQPDQTMNTIGNVLSGTGNIIQAGASYYANQPPAASPVAQQPVGSLYDGSFNNMLAGG